MYAGGRPLWQLSLALRDLQKPMPVPAVRWTLTTRRRMSIIRDRIMSMCGTDEPLIAPDGEEAAMLRVTMQWRKPLAVSEVNRMAPTPEVRERKGRP